MPEPTPTISSCAPAIASGSSERNQPGFAHAVLALGLGSFAIGTGEFSMMGLLPDVARDLGVTIPQAGHVVSAYALGVVIGAPMFAVLTAQWPRRTLLVALMALFAAGNFAGALSNAYLALNGLRFIAGLPHGAFFGVAMLVAAGMAPPQRRGRAVGLVMLGLTSSTLFGVPFAAWLGQAWGWRAAYYFVGTLAALASVWIHFAVPNVKVAHGVSPRTEMGALARSQVWLTLGVGAIGFGGMFAVFSYITPILTEVSHLPLASVPLVLSLFGVGMVAGSLTGSRLADWNLAHSIAGLLVWSALVLAGVSTAMAHPVSAVVWVFMIGTLVSIGPALQIRLMDVAGDAQTLAAALNHSSFNAANALGAWLGGVLISMGLGWTSTGWAGALLALGGLAIFAVSIRLEKRKAAVRGASQSLS